MGRVDEYVPGEKDIEKPTVCPACGSALVERGAHLFCENREGCKPHHIENIPESNLEMIRRVKYYERLAARGIVNRSRKDITECLTMHPLVGSYSLASKLTDEYIKLNAPYIGDWRD